MIKQKIKTKYNKIRYLPTLVGTLTPLSILLSFPCLIGTWINVDRLSDQKGDKGPVITSLVIIAIVCQLIATVALLARFWEKRIVLSTFLSIAFFTCHIAFILGPIIKFWVEYLPLVQSQANLKFTGDFMAGIGAALISFISVIFLLIDYFRQDQLRRKGSGITNSQRTLVVFAILVSMWSAIGAIIFSSVENWTFTRGIYFTMVTMTTIGFGDLVPKELGTRIFLFFYAIIGMVMMGILINSIRIVILEGFENIYMEKVEALYKTYYGESMSSNEDLGLLSTKQQLLTGHFEPQNASKIRRKQRKLLNNEKWTLLTRQLQFSILSLILFWFLGAVIFMLIEDWTYFDAVYFCFVSFTTVGYGDITIKTFPGILAFIGYSLLGLVAAAYVISVGTEMSSRIFERRIEKINYKHQAKIELENENEEQVELDNLLSKISNLKNENSMEVTCELISLCKIYQRHVATHLIDSDGLLSNEVLINNEFQQLESYHNLFCKILSHFEKKVDPNIISKYDTIISREFTDTSLNPYNTQYKDNEEDDANTIELENSKNQLP
ncbi:voltage-gated potassium channel [Neoconidiobolus thromboides FSU 785]|nr:voltage-gated potassium channel [Neoconidiobolus thromboides FSU 785]